MVAHDPADRLAKIGARIARHGRSFAFEIAEVAMPRGLSQEILASIMAFRLLPPVSSLTVAGELKAGLCSAGGRY